MGEQLTIVNGTVLGADGADAVRVRDGRIAAVGRAGEVGRGGEVVDARGGLVMPGFDDAHTHLLSGARALGGADLFGLDSQDAVLDAIRAHADATPDAPWVLGRGWLYAAFPGGLPTRELLDRVVPDRPALMECYDGHTGWANTAALRLAGVDRSTPDPLNGEVVRDADGEPTGVLKENAQAARRASTCRSRRGTRTWPPSARALRGLPRRGHHRGPGRLAGPGRARLLDGPRRRRPPRPAVPRGVAHAGRARRWPSGATGSMRSRRRRSRGAAATGSTPGSSRASWTA